MTIREDFEAWATPNFHRIARDEGGYYKRDATEHAWVAWQAATERAARLCEIDRIDGISERDAAYNAAIKNCAAAIRALGAEGEQ